PFHRKRMRDHAAARPQGWPDLAFETLHGGNEEIAEDDVHRRVILLPEIAADHADARTMKRAEFGEKKRGHREFVADAFGAQGGGREQKPAVSAAEIADPF